MCGITGYWSIPPNANLQEIVKQLTDALAHRGPDGEGVETFDEGKLAFGHRRLAIFDLSDAGRQPMSYRDRWTITYNGEIYNFLEIRNELQKLGHSFASDTDTEVILAAYAEWGRDCLTRFNGMWAFAIWDAQTKELFLARDRFGVKPLYYLHQPRKHFAFASEIHAFRSCPELRLSPDLENIAALLHDPNCLAPFGLSPYRDLRILPAAHTMLIRENLAPTEPRLWWRHTSPPSPDSHTGDTFDTLLQDACKLRIRADVPLATALSGGLDSSSIYATLRSLSPRQKRSAPGSLHQCFSMSFPGHPEDELKYARQVTDFHRAPLNVVTPDLPRLADELLRVTTHYGDLSGTPILCVTPLYQAMAEQGIRVSLDGHGGDECLLGYPDMLASLLGLPATSPHPELATTLKAMTTHPDPPPSTHSISIASKLRIRLGRLKQSLLPPSASVRAPEASTMQDSPLPQALFGKQDILAPPILTEHQNHLRELKQSVEGIHLAAMYWERLPLILRNFDKASMLHGVEIRAPFLDYRLASHCITLPLSDKVNRGYSKHILRKTTQGKLPEPILRRKWKVGINSPILSWLKDPKVAVLFEEKTYDSFQKMKSIFKDKQSPDQAIPRVKDIHSPQQASHLWNLFNAAVLMDN